MKIEKAVRTPTIESLVYALVNENMLPNEIKTMVLSLLDDKKLTRLIELIRRLPPEGQTRFLDRADQALPAVDAENAKFIVSLGIACSAVQRLPRSAQLFAGLEKRGSTPLIFTGLTDIWLGDHGHRPVSIEAFRNYPPQLFKELTEILWKRVPMLMRLSHPNILLFRGVNTILFQLALVYDGGGDSNIIQYTASHPDASRIALLLQAAKGLQYLHSLDVPHGDFRGNNVHVDGSGHARLTQYGLGPIKHNPRFTVAADPRAVESLLAPELVGVASPSVVESKAADVFAFAMLAYELCVGQPPYHGQSPAKTALLISRGARPEFPQNTDDVGFSTQMQNFVKRCWHASPTKRPTIDEVVGTLELTDREPQNAIQKSPNVHCLPEDVQIQPKNPRRKFWERWFCLFGY